jgi:hypothetical protein
MALRPLAFHVGVAASYPGWQNACAPESHHLRSLGNPRLDQGRGAGARDWSRQLRLPPFALALACLAGIACNALILGPGLIHTVRGQNDFLGLYPGGRLAGGSGVYDPVQSAAVQRQAVGYSNPRLLFCRPPYYAALMWPLARLPYFPAYLLFETLMLAAAAAFVRMWPATGWRTTLAATCWSLPLAAAFAIAQDVAALLAAIAGALLLLKRRRDFAAGLIFSLCAIKLHLFLLVPVWILARRLWRFAGGLAVGGAALAVLSLAAAGPGGFRAFVRTASSSIVNPGLEVMPNLNGLFHGNGGLELVAALAVAALVYQAAHRGSQSWALAATLVGGLLTSHHAYVADCALLLPALLVMASETDRDWQWYLALFLMAPVVYIGVYAGPAVLVTKLSLVVLCVSFAVAKPAVSRAEGY